jgi:hypothetical protein
MTIPTLDQRRALLRQAASGGDPNDYSGIAAAVRDTDEATRKAPVRTLPAMRL